MSHVRGQHDMSRDLLSLVGENPRSGLRVRHEQVLTYLSIQLSGGKNHMMRAESLRGGIDQSDPDPNSISDHNF